MEEVEAVSFDGKVPIGRPIFNTEVYLVGGGAGGVAAISDGGVADMMVASRNLAGGYVGGEGAGKFIESKVR